MYNPTKCTCLVTIPKTKIGQEESLHFSKWKKNKMISKFESMKIDANLGLS
jgi:hypothetical protein